MTTPDSVAERRAAQAEALPAFQNVNLTGIKASVGQILSLIGRNGIFSEYTLHDISHIDEMLALLDWLVPKETVDAMTPADWLLLVLAVYFHDAGMVVTQEEFAARDASGFKAFCDNELFVGKDGEEYHDKVADLGEHAERFLYEEFVRRQHADRIADWIMGRGGKRRGVSEAVAREVDEALSALPTEFRRDLALICQSHHLSDLHDTGKYKVSQPYGNSDAETANVQYAALLLRSADLLHITKDRTPSVLFRTINPQDPVSQREWAKQNAVRRVRAQRGRDRDGKVSDSAGRDTVEVFATFADANGFFGLTSYLRYAEGQLAKTHEWASASASEFDVPYTFPWRRVDDSEVTATGFLPQQLAFSLDQDKILELLTGHTLYNDTDVVIRELIQNSLDATRLQALIDGRDASTGKVEVRWDNETNELVIRDNGTGMSQTVIERNLLRAGASRYQEEIFRRDYPEFSPISRFGIGVLSTFMIADSVTITTCAPQDSQARQLTLRSVHGRYLVKLLDKETDAEAARLAPHGTSVVLRVRKSAQIRDVIATLRRWVVVPQCEVTAQIDEAEVVTIGYSGPKAALEAVLTDVGYNTELEEPADSRLRVQVIEKEYDGVRTAFAVRWSEYFREWAFVTTPERYDNEEEFRLGTCVEGIRVEDATPGFDGLGILAICNACGPAAPKTNVARSGLEQTPERTALLERAYRTYFEHVAAEAHELSSNRGVSLTWAAQETQVLLRPLNKEPSSRVRVDILDEHTFTQESRRHSLILVEADGIRRLASVEELDNEKLIWTVDSRFVQAAESLLREIPSTASLSALAESFGSGSIALPDELTLVGFRGFKPSLTTLVLRDREVARVTIRREQRRIDLAWSAVGGSGAWLAMPTDRDPQRTFRPTVDESVFVGVTSVPIDGRESEAGVRSYGRTFLFEDTPLAKYLVELHSSLESDPDAAYVLSLASSLGIEYLYGRLEPSAGAFIEQYLQRINSYRPVQARLLDLLDTAQLASVLSDTNGRLFDTSAWTRRADE